MNQRIKELAKQTGYIWHDSGDPQIYEFTPEKLEKLAELIVKECAEVAEDYDGAHYVGTAIKQHFGVEE
jgi:hypothetical protein